MNSCDNFILRDMRPAEIGAISALAIRSKASWGYDADMMKVFVEELTLTDASFAKLLAARIAMQNEKIVAYCTLLRRGETLIELENLFVDPDHFGQGLGRLMFAEAVALAAKHGATELTLIADPYATGFYEKLGAKVTGQHQSAFPGRSIPIMTISTNRDSS